MNLWQDFKTNDGRIIDKWMHYFPIYERHLAPWRNKTLTFIEIGVFKGGSLQMWQRFFGPLATIVGIDINPACASFAEPGVHVRIGDQRDPAFLQSILDEFGTPDVVLDDGSHKMADIKGSFDFLYPRLSKNGVYMVEDLHTAYWAGYGGGLKEPGSFINICKGFIDELNAVYTRGELPPTFISNHTLGISFYDSMVAFERGTMPVRATQITGDPAEVAKTPRFVPNLTPPKR
jgi:hypothetical protein